ncbi:MAG: cadherin-like domain-containing protein [Sulfitobacter sp.]
MIKTIDFNGLASGTVVDNEFAADGVTVSAIGGSGDAMIFDSANPTGGDSDLATDNLGGVLIVSEDGDSSNADDNASGGTLVFDFDNGVMVKSLTFLDIEEAAQMNFYDAEGNLIASHYVDPTGDNGQRTVGLNVDGVSRMEVVLNGSGAIDNLVFDDPGMVDPGEDQAPIANDDADETDEDVAITVDLIGNDSDPEGGALTVTAATVPAEQGTLVDNGDGTVTFTPAADFNGEATISYTVADAAGQEASALHVITVTPVNDAPVANDDSDVTEFNTAVTVDLLDNDSDVDGDALTVTDATVPAEQGTLVNNGDGTVTFTPADGFTGEATISYTIEDEEGLQDSALHTITVGTDGGNLPPIANDDADETDEDVAITVDLIGNDSDPEGGALTVTAATVPTEQGTLVDNGDGTVTFTPAADFNGEATISYTVADAAGQEASALHVITVTPVNDAPVANDDSDVTEFNTAVTVDLLDNDSDVDGDALTVTAATVPAEQGTLVNNGDGTVTFTPADGFTGEATISYTIEDAEGLQDSALHTITVGTDGNTAPVAADDSLSLDEDTTATINVLSNDSDADLDPLSVTEASSPDGDVVINEDGELEFTPNPDFNGETTITYTISDGNGGFDTATVAVTVNPINDDPVANDDTDSTTYETPVTIDVLGNDTDLDGDTLSVTAASSPDGEVINNGDGTLTFTPADGFGGDATISYTITDGNGGFDTATVTVTVRDGIVSGTDDGDLIDLDYTGDPDGDMVDHDDAIRDGETGNDDIIHAGGGNDTVNAADGDDEVLAGEGDDVVTGGAGDDILNGGAGNDSLDGNGDDDLIDGGEGDDQLYGGAGNDTIYGRDGQDTVDGGSGDDFIDTSSGDLAPDQGYPFADTDPLGYDPDADPENDRDLVNGGAGNDTIRTGDDADTITGGSGNDVIDGGIDDDDIQGNGGDDRIVGGEGNDIIFGGSGNDTIYAGNDPDLGLDALDLPDEATDGSPFSPDRNPNNGRDTVHGGAGDDVIYGADDDDLLSGGSGDDYIDGQMDDDTLDGDTGNDTLVGGHGNDSLIGGAGNDTLLGGIGNDTMIGGGDRDFFAEVNAGDVVDGSENGDDFDTLDLTGSAPDGGRLEVEYADDNPENGTVYYYDADNNAAGELVFTNIENVIPCFTPGTKIATAKGEVSVENLQVGDRVITRDNGIQKIRWVGHKEMTGEDLAANPKLHPVLIRAGALGNDLPERDMMVSPNHRVLMASDKTALYFEDREVLVAAKHLTDLDGVDAVEVSNTTYIHVMFDQHEVILSDGTWTESFQPGDHSLAGVGDEQRAEILALFPELATREGIDGYTSARRALKKHEAKLLSN